MRRDAASHQAARLSPVYSVHSPTFRHKQKNHRHCRKHTQAFEQGKQFHTGHLALSADEDIHYITMNQKKTNTSSPEHTHTHTIMHTHTHTHTKATATTSLPNKKKNNYPKHNNNKNHHGIRSHFVDIHPL